jgi:hypothetical protein
VNLAVLVAIATTWAAGHGGAGTTAGLTAGFGVGFLVAATVLVVASVGALALPSGREAHQSG